MPTFDPTKPVVTDGGDHARIICTDAEGLYPIIALVRHYPGAGETPVSYNRDGYEHQPGSGSCLINAPERRSEFVNIYPRRGGVPLQMGGFFGTLEKARAASATRSAGVLEVAIDENGKFIEAILHEL